MSHATDAVVGMMDGAYFTSRNEILNFFNTLLDLNLSKIEQTASGAVACQLTEYIFPNSIPMSRVNWAAKASHEYVANYKLLQSAFNKHNIQRHVDVDKLIRGKYQDNLEFCQWLKAFFDQTSSMSAGVGGRREGYDPVAVRARGKGGTNLAINKVGVKRVGGSATSSASAASSRMMGNARIGASGSVGGGNAARASTTTTTTASYRPTSSGSAASSMTRGSISTANTRVSTASSNGGGGGQKENTSNTSSAPSSLRQVPPQKQQSLVSTAVVTKYEEEIRTLQSDFQSLQTKYSELEHTAATTEMTLQTVESERDFYFEKLRGIEVMLQVYKEKEEEQVGSGNIRSVMDGIFKVMYATMEDNVMVDDEGNLVGDIDITGGEVSMDKSATLSVKAQDELDGKVDDEVVEGEEEEQEKHLTEGSFHDTLDYFPNPTEELAAYNAATNSFEMDDDELLTSDLDAEPANTNNHANDGMENNDVGSGLGVVQNHEDDDDFSDEDLLAD